jgi:glycosyltransferase involved in cell wall biosynthesis
MISILIPTYTEEIGELVRELHSQAESLSTDFEILVYNDGCDKPCLQNEEVNALEKVTYRHFNENVGRGAIRDRLATDAKADSLLFLDADVFPTQKDFLSKYISSLNENCDVICGGVAYKEDGVTDNERLRYVYGKEREAKSVKKREKEAHIIVTANILIRKSCFFKVNLELENLYGEDLIISQNLKRMEYVVEHIDNPVWHLGLEDSDQFIEKSKEAIEHMVRWEKEGKLDSNFTNLQRHYRRLKWALPFISFFMKMAHRNIIKPNLTSKRPNSFLFNMSRLHYYYLEKKKHA